MILYWRHDNHAVSWKAGRGMRGIRHDNKRPSQIFLTDIERNNMGKSWEDYYHRELLQCIESRQLCDVIVAVTR